jgi:hypothetical protein
MDRNQRTNFIERDRHLTAHEVRTLPDPRIARGRQIDTLSLQPRVGRDRRTFPLGIRDLGNLRPCSRRANADKIRGDVIVTKVVPASSGNTPATSAATPHKIRTLIIDSLARSTRN